MVVDQLLLMPGHIQNLSVIEEPVKAAFYAELSFAAPLLASTPRHLFEKLIQHKPRPLSYFTI